MSIAKILAPVTGGARDTAVLANAIEAAKPFNAHVMAFFVRPDLTEALAFFTDGVSGVVVEEVVKATKDAGDEAAKRIEATIDAVCARAMVERVRRPTRAATVTRLGDPRHQRQGPRGRGGEQVRPGQPLSGCDKI